MRDMRRSRRILSDLGARVAEARQLRGLTQEELAESVGVATRHIQRIESGAVDIPVTLLADLGKALAVDNATLLMPTLPRRRRPGRPSM